jgi:c-di-GMP-binding flagellar brake protein YcgR
MSANLAEAPGSWLTLTAAIERLVTRVRDRHSLLSVTVAGVAGIASSILLRANLVSGKLLFDGLYPPAIGSQVKIGTPLSISAILDGSRFEFSCTVEQIEDLDGGVAYRTGLPARVRHFERRTSYRVRIPPAMHIPPMIFTGDTGPLRATLLDLSREGAGALFNDHVAAEIGSCLPCTIHLPEARLLTVAEIRSCRTTADRALVGVRLDQLRPAQRHMLDNSIALLERYLRQHNSGLRSAKLDKSV